MLNREYRQFRHTDKPCTAIVLPIGNRLRRGIPTDFTTELVFNIHDTACRHCGFESDENDYYCPSCWREK